MSNRAAGRSSAEYAAPTERRYLPISSVLRYAPNSYNGDHDPCELNLSVSKKWP